MSLIPRDVIATDKLLFFVCHEIQVLVASVWSNVQENGNLPSKPALEHVIL